LKKVYIPGTVTMIEANAFNNCHKKIAFAGDSEKDYSRLYTVANTKTFFVRAADGTETEIKESDNSTIFIAFLVLIVVIVAIVLFSMKKRGAKDEKPLEELKEEILSELEEEKAEEETEAPAEEATVPEEDK
ncbi:MAG: hypothetical protein GX851_00905, partial [Clostridiales bacterium]|nr:hypothetical protein [Clostridiales bacterium]